MIGGVGDCVGEDVVEGEEVFCEFVVGFVEVEEGECYSLDGGWGGDGGEVVEEVGVYEGLFGGLFVVFVEGVEMVVEEGLEVRVEGWEDVICEVWKDDVVEDV